MLLVGYAQQNIKVIVQFKTIILPHVLSHILIGGNVSLFLSQKNMPMYAANGLCTTEQVMVICQKEPKRQHECFLCPLVTLVLNSL